MIGQAKTRAEIGKECGLRGKALTCHLKQLMAQGGVIRHLRFVEPAKSPKRQAVYPSAPQNLTLPI